MEFWYERLQDFCYRCGRVDHLNTECIVAVSTEGEAGYGEWTKAPPVRDVVVIARPLSLGTSEQRQAGTVRCNVIPLCPDQRTESSRGQPGAGHNLTDVSGVVSSSLSWEQNKWRRRSRPKKVHEQLSWPRPQAGSHLMWTAQAGSIPQMVGLSSFQSEDGQQSVMLPEHTEGMETQSGTEGMVVGAAGELFQHSGLSSGVSSEVSGVKRGEDYQIGELSLLPFKKVRGLGTVGTSKAKMVEKWCSMSIQERCLMVERNFYVNEEVPEVPSEFKDLVDCLEEEAEVEKCQTLDKKRVKWLRVVGAGPLQPQVHHDLFILELPGSWVGHGSSSSAWAYQEPESLYDFSFGDKDEKP